MRLQLQVPMSLFSAAVLASNAAAQSDEGVALPASPDRVLLQPGECAATVTGEHRLRWFCAPAAPAEEYDIRALEQRFGVLEHGCSRFEAENARLQRLLAEAEARIAALHQRLAETAVEGGAAAANDVQQLAAAPAPTTAAPVADDADRDAVADAADLCPDTRPGLAVDSAGCAPGQETVLQGVTFSWNSTELTTGSQAVLREVAARLQMHPGIDFEVAGHTDSSGDASVNLAVSTERARAVREFLVANGVDGARMKVRGYGEEKPISSNATAAGRALNRRVSLIRLR